MGGHKDVEDSEVREARWAGVIGVGTLRDSGPEWPRKIGRGLRVGKRTTYPSLLSHLFPTPHPPAATVPGNAHIEYEAQPPGSPETTIMYWVARMCQSCARCWGRW